MWIPAVPIPSSKYWLFFQRPPVQFPASTWQSTVCNYSSRGFSTLTQTHIHINAHNTWYSVNLSFLISKEKAAICMEAVAVLMKFMGRCFVSKIPAAQTRPELRSPISMWEPWYTHLQITPQSWEFLGLAGQLVYSSVNFKFSERPCLKKEGREEVRKTQDTNLQICVQERIHTCVCMHTNYLH